SLKFYRRGDFTMMSGGIGKYIMMGLAGLLLLGGVIGAQIGVRLSGRFNAEQLRVLLAIIVLAVCIKILMDLLVGGPAVQFSFGQGGGGHA
ncbi:MAG: hypothetical protein ACPG4D_05925, partial [Alphaproteobacteria bacterium]